MARADDVRSHRRGQDLIRRLLRALVDRGRGHLEAGRFAQATADCEKAALLGGNLTDVAALRTSLEQAAQARQEQDRRKADAMGAARDHIHNGQLSLGGQWLASVDDTHRAERLRGEIDARRSDVEASLVRAEEAVKREDWPTAVHLLLHVRQVHSTNPRLAELTGQVSSRLAERARAALAQGRLDQAQLLVGMSRPLCGTSVELAGLVNALSLIRRAAEAVGAGQCRRAVESLAHARAVLPEAAWLEQALSEAQRAAESMERLRSGPLGMVMDSEATAPAEGGKGDTAGEQTVVVEPRGLKPAARVGDAPLSLPRRLMLHVDGIGSFLVVRDRAVTLGAAAGSRSPDIPLLVDSSAGPATIERADEDYFLTCSRPVAVNNQPVQRKLLGNGDRIALSPKCRIRFTVPNAATTSALLSIAGVRLPGTDATRVVLMDRSLVIGPGTATHVRADDLPAPVVLHVRDGRLFCNTDQEITVDGRPMDRQGGLPLNAQVRIGPLSMVIKAAS